MKRQISLSDEQKKVYKQMKQMALAEMNGKMVTYSYIVLNSN